MSNLIKKNYSLVAFCVVLREIIFLVDCMAVVALVRGVLKGGDDDEVVWVVAMVEVVVTSTCSVEELYIMLDQ